MTAEYKPIFLKNLPVTYHLVQSLETEKEAAQLSALLGKSAKDMTTLSLFKIQCQAMCHLT